MRDYERRRRRLPKVARLLEEEKKVARGCETIRGGGEGCLRLQDYKKRRKRLPELARILEEKKVAQGCETIR